MVFETAYNTNENLLICAPTGAGKTNIAMLTVLHEIHQHLQPGGVIKKDEFKVWHWHTTHRRLAAVLGVMHYDHICITLVVNGETFTWPDCNESWVMSMHENVCVPVKQNHSQNLKPFLCNV